MDAQARALRPRATTDCAGQELHAQQTAHLLAVVITAAAAARFPALAILLRAASSQPTTRATRATARDHAALYMEAQIKTLRRQPALLRQQAALRTAGTSAARQTRRYAAVTTASMPGQDHALALARLTAATTRAAPQAASACTTATAIPPARLR